MQAHKIPRGTYLQLQIVKFSSIFMDSGLFSQYFAYKRYFNTIIGPWDLSRIVDNGRLYILTEYIMYFGLVWLGPAWSGPVQPGSGPGPARVRSRSGPGPDPIVPYFFYKNQDK